MTSDMKNSTQVARRLLVLAAASSWAVIVGCGADDGLGKRYAVSGKVSYKGAAIEKGTVNFVPDGPEGRPATGTIENGSYSLTTLTPGDGAVPGKYRVTIDTRQIDEAAAKEATKKYLEKMKVPANANIQIIPQDVQAKVLSQTKSNIPGKYQIFETTDLKDIKVEARSNTIDLDLKD